MSRQSILVTTRNFPPLTGGMERLMRHSVEALANDHDVTLIGPSGCSRFVPAGVRVIECPSSPLPFLLMSTLKGLYRAWQSKYDLVLGGSGLVAPVTWLQSRIARAKSAVFVHGLDLVVDNWFYHRAFLPFIRRHECIIANSSNTRRIAADKGCAVNKITVINPGTAIPPPLLGSERRQRRIDLGVDDARVALFVGRIVQRKGLVEFIELAWPTIQSNEPNALLLVAGDTAENALVNEPDQAERMRRALQQIGEETVRFLGSVDDDTLWRCYAAADVLLFPLLRVSGDVEGFGMVAIEAAACGTPTVAFPVGGVVDAVAEGVSGRFVAEGDYDAFAAAVLSIFRTERPGRHSCREHADNFSWQVHSRKLQAALGLSAGASAA